MASKATRDVGLGPTVVIALAVLGLIGAEITFWLAYHYAPTQINAGTLWVVTPDPGGAPISLYESYRIFFVHLPAAYATALCCVLTLLGGVMWLLNKRAEKKAVWENLIVSAAEIGLVAGSIVLLTGSFWADFAWGSGRVGSGWNWEPRLTTALILWLAFAALLVLRRAMDTPAMRARVTAIYGILLSPLYPLVNKAIEIGQTSHPRSFSTLLGAPEIATTKLVATFAMILVFVALLALRFVWNNLATATEQERMA